MQYTDIVSILSGDEMVSTVHCEMQTRTYDTALWVKNQNWRIRRRFGRV